MKKSFVFALALLSIQVWGQISVTMPNERAIFQRNNSNQATFYIAGNFSGMSIGGSSIEVQARLTPINGGTLVNWTTIATNPKKGIYNGTLQATGGWYTLEVRAVSGSNILNSDNTRKVGVGEVFVVAGQSNAQGRPGNGAIGAEDDRVNCVNWNDICSNSLPIYPVVSKMVTNAKLSIYGHDTWCYGKLGDSLVARLGVPVIFINAGADGSTMLNWEQSSNGQPTNHAVAGYQYCSNIYPYNDVVGLPYGVLKNALNYYASMYGIRAVLWHQGEGDTFKNTNTTDYVSRLTNVINKSRSYFGGGSPTWVVSRASYNKGVYSQAVIDGQNYVVNNVANVLPGPFTDNLQIPRYDYNGGLGDDVHFGGSGLIDLANAWNNALDATFFANSTPVSANPLPKITASCASSGNFALSVSGNHSSYFWVNNDGDINSAFDTNIAISKSSGTYRCYIKDGFGNTTVTQPVSLPLPIYASPSTPESFSITSTATSLTGLQGVSLFATGCSDGTILWTWKAANFTNTSPVGVDTRALLNQIQSQSTIYVAVCDNSSDCTTASTKSNTIGVKYTCPQNYQITTPFEEFDFGDFSVSQQINANNTIMQGANILYDAGKHILLLPGFKAESGSVFIAKPGGCSN